MDLLPSLAFLLVTALAQLSVNIFDVILSDPRVGLRFLHLHFYERNVFAFRDRDAVLGGLGLVPGFIKPVAVGREVVCFDSGWLFTWLGNLEDLGAGFDLFN